MAHDPPEPRPYRSGRGLRHPAVSATLSSAPSSNSGSQSGKKPSSTSLHFELGAATPPKQAATRCRASSHPDGAKLSHRQWSSSLMSSAVPLSLAAVAVAAAAGPAPDFAPDLAPWAASDAVVAGCSVGVAAWHGRHLPQQIRTSRSEKPPTNPTINTYSHAGTGGSETAESREFCTSDLERYRPGLHKGDQQRCRDRADNHPQHRIHGIVTSSQVGSAPCGFGYQWRSKKSTDRSGAGGKPHISMPPSRTDRLPRRKLRRRSLR